MSNLRNFERYITIEGHRKRMVNQREIFEWLKEKGPMTESKIFEKIYSFYRGGMFSNKKYAECLRRLLATGKIARRKNENNLFEYYTTVTNFNDKPVSKDKSVSKEVSPKSLLQNFDIVQTRNGKVYLVCVDKGILINIEYYGFNYINQLNDDLTNYNSLDEWDIMEVYRSRNDISLRAMVEFKRYRSDFEKIWERPKVKVYSYTNEELKAKLGIPTSDKLVITD